MLAPALRTETEKRRPGVEHRVGRELGDDEPRVLKKITVVAGTPECFREGAARVRRSAAVGREPPRPLERGRHHGRVQVTHGFERADVLVPRHRLPKGHQVWTVLDAVGELDLSASMPFIVRAVTSGRPTSRR